MIHSDDVAMKFEALIRYCFQCNRYEHNADADTYRTLASQLELKEDESIGIDAIAYMVGKIMGGIEKNKEEAENPATE